MGGGSLADSTGGGGGGGGGGGWGGWGLVPDSRTGECELGPK